MRNLFGIECIIFDYALLCPPADVNTTLRPTTPGSPNHNASALHSLGMSEQGQMLIQRILNQTNVTPIVMLVDDMAEINPEYLHLLKNCAVTFVVKPPGKDVRHTGTHKTEEWHSDAQIRMHFRTASFLSHMHICF